MKIDNLVEILRIDQNWLKYIEFCRNLTNWSKLSKLVEIIQIGRNLSNWSKPLKLVETSQISRDLSNWSKLFKKLIETGLKNNQIGRKFRKLVENLPPKNHKNLITS